jgi:hypothetical protein
MEVSTYKLIRIEELSRLSDEDTLGKARELCGGCQGAGIS